MAIIAVIVGIAATAARYATQVSGNAGTRVASWHVEITDENSEPLTTNFTLVPDVYNSFTQVAEGKIAPGSELSTSFFIDLYGTEVATDIEAIITYDFSKLPTGAIVEAWLQSAISDNFCAEDLEDEWENPDGVITCSGTASLNDVRNRGRSYFEGDILVEWENNEQQNPSDTAAGTAAENISFNVQITAKQHFE